MTSRADVDERLSVLSGLSQGWDGYHAQPFSREAIDAARVVAYLLADAGKHFSMVPTSGETIAIEWMEGDIECLADIDATRSSEI